MKSLEQQIKDRERSRIYAQTHKQERLEYRQGRKEDKAKQDHLHYEANKPRLRAQQDAYKEAHAEERSVYAHNHHLDTKDAKRVYDHEHYVKNRVKIRAHVDNYFDEHPEARKLIHFNRRAREFNAKGVFTPEEFKAKCNLYNNCCVYCGRENIVNGCVVDLEAEHAIPLIRGGDNTIDNILPTCKSCNCSKHTKTFEEFLLLHTTEEQEVILTRIYLADHPEEALEDDKNNGDS